MLLSRADNRNVEGWRPVVKLAILAAKCPLEPNLRGDFHAAHRIDRPRYLLPQVRRPL